MDKIYAKQFIVDFKRPIYKRERNRRYVLEYDVEEPEGILRIYLMWTVENTVSL